MSMKGLKAFFDPDPEKLNYRPDWKSMSPGDRASYIWTYYKIPIIIGVVILYFIGYLIVQWATRTNEILYAGSVNLVLSEEQRRALTDEYTSNPAFGFGKRDRVSFTDLGFISDDPNSWMSPVANVTQVKLLASIAADQLDVVFMNQEAFDLFCANEALLDLKGLADWESGGGESALTPNGLGIDMTGIPLFQGAGFDGPVYAGILEQTSRVDESVAYLQYVREGR